MSLCRLFICHLRVPRRSAPLYTDFHYDTFLKIIHNTARLLIGSIHPSILPSIHPEKSSKVFAGVASTCKTSHRTCKTSDFRISDFPIFLFFEFPNFKISDFPIFRFSDVRFSEFQIFRISEVRIFRISDFPTFRFFKFPNLRLSIPLIFRFSDFPNF